MLRIFDNQEMHCKELTSFNLIWEDFDPILHS